MLDIKKHEPLSLHTTLQIGGEAEYLAKVTTRDGLVDAIVFAQEKGLSWRLLGGGSNVLAPDDGVPGLTIVIATKGRKETTTAAGVLLRVEAGEVFDEVVADTCAQGYWGLENLSAIPGSIGATPIQNVGAYGAEIQDVLHEVEVFDTRSHTFVTLSKNACRFGYRHSLFKEEEGKGLVVVSVTFLLSQLPQPRLSYRDLAARFSDKDETPTPQTVRDAVVAIRAKKFPNWKVVGTAGSFFKNPIISAAHAQTLADTYPQLPLYPLNDGRVKVALGWILEHVCSLRGVREGNVGTYEGQALVLVNHGGATAHEVVLFAEKICACVYERTQIVCEWEVTQLK